MKLESYFTQQKHDILKKLDTENPLTQTQISEQSNTTQATISNHIRKLEEENLVKNNGLRKGYTLTEKGEHLLKLMEDAQKLW